ncbi:MAG: hypothetical protein LBK61_08970 [Spirochaetaceae bacterium]|jgi:hypothetical protein|nr:hypothetical protein [Spirochaetaceae bacterium]
MYGITRTKVVLCLFVFAVVSSVASAQERTQERTRGVYIGFGLGLGGISYLGGDTKTIVDGFKREDGTHITVDLDALTIGGALRDDLYLVGTVASVSDWYPHAETNENPASISLDMLAISMYGLGLRWYPLQSKKHLQLGYDLCVGHMQIQPEESEDISYTGFSQRVSVGWDFDSTLTGLAVILGGDATFNIIEGDLSISYALFAKLVFK